MKSAIRDFDQVIQLNPNIAEAYNNRSLAYAYLSDSEKAISDINMVLELCGSNKNLCEEAKIWKLRLEK
jgi:regulator of sirC expression with transglutaminase-like and TPR domain